MKTLYPLTNAQKSIWVADNLYPGTSQAVLSATAIIREAIDFTLMNEAVNKVIEKNDALRIRLLNHEGMPQQYFADFVYKKFDVLDFSYENGEKDYKKWEKDMAEAPFPLLIDSELFDFFMIKLGEEKNICFFKFHHTISDAWGVVLVIRKTLQEYWQLLHGEASEAVETSYIDHINDELEYLASERFDKHKEFWSGAFDTVPEFISMSDKGISSLTGKRKNYVLSPALSSRLREYCDYNKVSGFSVFYALLALYLSKKTNKKDIAIETPILNRSGKAEKNTAGMFMNNIPTRISVEPNLDFLTFVNESYRELKKFMRNQRYPYSSILKDFRERHQFSGTLVDVTLNYHNAKLDSVIEYEGIWNYCGSQTNSLSIQVSDRADTGLQELDYDYLLEVFTEEDIEQMHNNMCNLLTDALDNPAKKLSELQMLSKDELSKLLVEFNQTDLPYESKNVSELFEDQVIKSPDSIAVVFNDKSLTYSELNERANQLARFIQSKGITRNSIVGIMVNRSLEMVIGILGILKAGAAYLPIDPSYPRERIVYMLDQSHTQLTLINEDKVEIPIDQDCMFVNISLSNQMIYSGEKSNLEKDKNASPEDLAYVLFTSGSTGKPKGVMVPHRALCNLVNSIARNLNFKNQTIVSITTISFDIFFGDTILPLTQGMKVIIANEEEQTISRYLFDLISKHKADVLQATPSRMKLILSERQGIECLNGLSHLLITGEAFPPQLLPVLKSVTHAEIFNLYGPTETTVWSTMTNVTRSEKIMIGKPIANTQIYILDDHFSPVSLNSVGEIYIAGDGVSLGYLHNPELTQERFLPDPFRPGQIMYRTGDLGRWLRNGEIECLGRNDNQIKIRGLRIEVEEIEASLLTHAAVKEAVVAVKEDKVGKKHLIAYLTQKGKDRPSQEDLKSHVLKSLPNYMAPAWFSWLEAIPLTPNGKIDRRSLPEPNEMDFKQFEHAYIAPANDTERKLAKLWAEALEMERVGIDDNLFVLGGDSLTILEIMSGALAYEWKLTAQDFYECPTIRQLSSKMEGRVQEEKEAHNFIFSRVKPLEIVIKPMNTGNVLLTGATGFLGIHILYELLVQTDKDIYCLVRGDQAKLKFDKMLSFYFPALSETFKSRIIVVRGDISLNQFGLSDDLYEDLGQKVQTILHCGALVKHYGNYSEFEKINVQGTQEVINFCLKFNKKLNHISTISISGDFLADQFQNKTVFSEEGFYIGQDYKVNVYIRSKFEAENLIFKAEMKGLEATIFRVGVVTGRYLDGKFQHNIEQNAFYRRIKSLVSLRVIPESFLDQSIEFTPVDFCARGIVNIVKVNQTPGLVFHMFNHQKIRAIELVSFLRELNIPVQTLTNLDFDAYITRLSQTKEGKEKLSGLVTDLSINKRLNYNNAVIVDSTFTINYLKQTDFEWPEVAAEYLMKVLSNMREVGFIEESISDIS